MTSARTPTIHRDRTFTYRGRRYALIRGTDRRSVGWDGYTVVALLSERPGDWIEVEEALHSFTDVRWYLAQAVREGWPYLPLPDGTDAFTRHTGGPA